MSGPEDTEVIDAHQYLWDPATGGYPWLTPDLGPIDRPGRRAAILGGNARRSYREPTGTEGER